MYVHWLEFELITKIKVLKFGLSNQVLVELKNYFVNLELIPLARSL